MNIIFWDFDGVILDSMIVRDAGFREIFKKYDTDKVNKLIDYHRENGGLSRYVKIRHFYEKILNKKITDVQLQQYASAFSDIMRKRLVDPQNLISDSISFIKENFNNYKFHIVSGSDGDELRFLCKQLELDKYFVSIHGSPTPKTVLVKKLLEKHEYERKSCCLIGDAINDYKASQENNIDFYGYNNINLKDVSKIYIENFKHFTIN